MSFSHFITFHLFNQHGEQCAVLSMFHWPFAATSQGKIVFGGKKIKINCFCFPRTSMWLSTWTCEVQYWMEKKHPISRPTILWPNIVVTPQARFKIRRTCNCTDRGWCRSATKHLMKPMVRPPRECHKAAPRSRKRCFTSGTGHRGTAEGAEDARDGCASSDFTGEKRDVWRYLDVGV